jgi:hypothetical protein
LSGRQPQTPIEVGHKHVSLEELKALFGKRFEIEDAKYCSLLAPLFGWIIAVGCKLPIRLLPRWLDGMIGRLEAWESGVKWGPVLSYHIRLVARRAPITQPRPTESDSQMAACHAV